jgi:hypothetical protein
MEWLPFLEPQYTVSLFIPKNKDFTRSLCKNLKEGLQRQILAPIFGV